MKAAKQVQLEVKPNTAHGRPVKGDTVKVITKLEVDSGDYVIVHLTMPVAEVLERAERVDIPDMWPVVEARLKREVLRREQ